MITTNDVPLTFFAHYPGMTSCAWCDVLIKRSEAYLVARQLTPYTADLEHFCSVACAEKWRGTFHAEE